MYLGHDFGVGRVGLGHVVDEHHRRLDVGVTHVPLHDRERERQHRDRDDRVAKIVSSSFGRQETAEVAKSFLHLRAHRGFSSTRAAMHEEETLGFPLLSCSLSVTSWLRCRDRT
jgi:hypothetical protein